MFDTRTNCEPCLRGFAIINFGRALEIFCTRFVVSIGAEELLPSYCPVSFGSPASAHVSGDKPEAPSQASADTSLRRDEEASTWKPLVLCVVFALCIAPTFVSYLPYSFRWDDSDYLRRALDVSNAFWSGHVHGMRAAMVSVRPPIMTSLGLPWGPLASWDGAGKCFITLAALTALLVACCLFMLLRVGLQPLQLVISSACIFAALGPYPAGAPVHRDATAFMADCLFGWTAFAAILLIPYEASNPTTSSVAGGLARGALWAVILSIGILTKLNFLYFIALTIPLLLLVKARHSGSRNTLLSLLALCVCALPAVVFYLRYGRIIFDYAWQASFGPIAGYYFSPFLKFVGWTLKQSPGMWLSLILLASVGVYLVVKRRDLLWRTSLLPIIIMIGFSTICLASRNREVRFLLPALISFPFLIWIPISSNAQRYSRRKALAMATLSFCVLALAAFPMRHRPDRACLSASEAVLAAAMQSNAKKVLLATDSSSLNANLLNLAIAASPSRPPIEIDSLAWNAGLGTSIEEDFRHIGDVDIVVFQDKTAQDFSTTNLRATEYERYTQRHFGEVPMKVMNGLRIYKVTHN
jgi:hypothetical protein